MCARHIYANWKKSFSRSEYKILFWQVAYSFNSGEYADNMKLVMDYDPSAHQAIIGTEPEKWCRAFFSPDSHCPDVHNNLSEAFNRTIKLARAKPVLSMLEDIRRQAMNRISRRFMVASKCNTALTPKTMAILEKARVGNKFCKTHRSSSNLYEVTEYGCGYTVSLPTHECACRRWDLTGIPCKHAICVLDDNKEDAVNYVAEYYYTDMMKSNYGDNIRPVNGEKFWRQTFKTPIGLPEIRKKRGRKSKRDRKKETFEDLKNKGKATRHGRVVHCSNCLEAGHIKRGCKNEKVVVEGPKRRRGRPFKQTVEGVAPRAKKPRQKRNTTSVESNSQPIQEGESSFLYPAASSAPADTSSRPTKPHVKKPPRKTPLKVKKQTTNATTPRGQGVFWSPFTHRQFGVYDRLDTHDQTSHIPPQSEQPPHSEPPQQSEQPSQPEQNPQ